MREKIITLTHVARDKKVVLVSIEAGWGMRRRLADIGLREGMLFTVLQAAINGPCIIRLGNSRLAIGYGMASRMLVKLVEN